MPPALVTTAEYDPLRAEGELYARRLQQAGIPVRLTRYDGMIQGFFTLGSMIDQGKRAIQEAAEAVRAAFGLLRNRKAEMQVPIYSSAPATKTFQAQLKSGAKDRRNGAVNASVISIIFPQLGGGIRLRRYPVRDFHHLLTGSIYRLP